MKIVRLGKVYNYDYKTILIKGDYYSALKKIAKKENKPLGKMISILVEHYESSIR